MVFLLDRTGQIPYIAKAISYTRYDSLLLAISDVREMPIDLKKPDPLYLQISDDISARILKGEFHLGDQLGSQQAISLEYGVSLITVKKALSHLAQQG